MAAVIRRARVEGRVQGVWYRAATAERAGALGVGGDARHPPAGSVGGVKAGAAAAVQALIDWLWTGPPLARVTAVIVTAVEERADGTVDAVVPEGFLRR